MNRRNGSVNWLGWLLPIVIIGVLISNSLGNASEKRYDNKMQGIVIGVPDDSGDKIAAYMTNTGKYTKKYVPSELRAGNEKDVGYVLKIAKKSQTDIAQYMMGGAVSVEREVLEVELVKRSTGMVIDSKEFISRIPAAAKEGTEQVSTSVEPTDVQEWLRSVRSK